VGDPQHQRQAPLYLQEMAQEAPAADAFPRAFGLDQATLEREIRMYVRKRVFEVQIVPVQPEEDLRFIRRDLSRPEAIARLGNLLASLDPTLWPAAAEHFHAALALDPEQAQAQAGLGRLEALAGRPKEALPWLERAAARAPDDFVIQYLFGVALLDTQPDRKGLQRARDAFGRAVALQPEYGEAWARLAYAQAEEDPDTLAAAALGSFETAHRLLPTRSDIAFNLVLAYARSGKRDRAQDVIEHTLVPHGTPDEVRRARSALVQEERREVEELIGKGDLTTATTRLEGLLARAATPEQRAELAARLEDVRQVLAYNRFVDRYNHAMEIAGRDPQGAIAILEDLVATTREPGQLEQARRVLESLKSERKR
jgi:tetratricopeptide (TPR) repeat protein